MPRNGPVHRANQKQTSKMSTTSEVSPWHGQLYKIIGGLNRFNGTPTLPSASAVHYENTPMQYTAIFHCCKIDNFQLKSFDYVHIFAQNICCGYTVEPPQRVPTIYVLEQKLENNVNPCKLLFYCIKVGCRGYKTHGHVILM